MYQDKLNTCEHCGGDYGGYTVGVMQHYCPRLGGRRMFRDVPTESQQESEDSNMRDPRYHQLFNDKVNEARRR